METEEEQVEKLKAWLKENGLSIVLGIVIGVGGIGGYNYWTHVQDTAAAEASAHYDRMIDALNADDGEQVRERADAILADYADTEYAALARLALARLHVDNEDFAAAAQALDVVANDASRQGLAYLARTRLAAVQIQQEQFDQALQTLSGDFPLEFAARVEELRGDALASQGKADEAVAAYRKAQLAIPAPANPEFLRQKINDLGSSG